VLDGNFIAAKSAYDLRYTLVALGARDGHVAWRHTLDASNPHDATGARYQPVYLDGQVYVGYYYEHSVDPQNVVYHGVVEALDAATGKVRWRREVGTEPAGEPVVDGSTVYVSASVLPAEGQQSQVESGLLEALDVRTGAVRWQRALEGTPSMAASADGRVFVMASRQFSGHLLALDASDGAVAWDYTSDAPLTPGDQNGESNAPLVVDGRVYVQATERNGDGTANLKLLALNARDGSVAWQHQTGGIAATPAFNQDRDTLCLSTFAPTGDVSTILGLAVSSGATRWGITDLHGVSGCTASGNNFYLTQRSSDLETGSVFALSSHDGRQLWKTSTGAPIIAAGALPPVMSGGMAAVYLQGPTPTRGPVMSTLAVLRMSDGKPLWRHDFGGNPDHLVDIEGNLIFNPELLGGLPIVTTYALDTGTPLWRYALGHL
jgi:outer membrane protein assembly factor BamB